MIVVVSTGNDIIALAATDSHRTCRDRFFSRIINQDEKQHYHSFPENAGLSFSYFVWLIWSIKESAYKYCSRADPQLVYAPLKFAVETLESGDSIIEGRARYQDILLYSRSWLNDRFIATIVSDEPEFDGILHGVHQIASPEYASQSVMVREHALASLACHFPGATLRIGRAPGGPPVVWNGDEPLNLPISLAHHDQYVAYAYRLPPNARRT